MLDSLFGIRHILLAPLAAGYVWLVFLFFVAGAPTKVTDAPRPLEPLLQILPALGETATAVAVSFVAYFIGSLSQDLFGRELPRGLDRASDLLSRRAADLIDSRERATVGEVLDAAKRLEHIQSTVTEDQRVAGTYPDREAERQRSRAQIRGALEDLKPALEDLRAAAQRRTPGVTESQELARLEAEASLRTAISLLFWP